MEHSEEVLKEIAQEIYQIHVAMYELGDPTAQQLVEAERLANEDGWQVKSEPEIIHLSEDDLAKAGDLADDLAVAAAVKMVEQASWPEVLELSTEADREGNMPEVEAALQARENEARDMVLAQTDSENPWSNPPLNAQEWEEVRRLSEIAESRELEAEKQQSRGGGLGL